MVIATVDFETYYDDRYSLRHMTVEEYVRDERFEVIGVAVKFGINRAKWFSGQQVVDVMGVLRAQKDLTVVAHNAKFDAFIMSHHYNVFPKHVYDTISMARPELGQIVSMSLASLAEHLGFGEKGTEVLNARGMRFVNFMPEELHRYGEYACNDAELCYRLFQHFRDRLCEREMRIIDETARMFTDPRLVLNKEVLEEAARAEGCAVQDKLEATGLPVRREHLTSDTTFAKLLTACGVEPPVKTSARTGKTAFAFAKTDKGFVSLRNHKLEVVRNLVEARLAVKSTIKETRAKRLMGIAARGPWPVDLNYYGAHTGRYSGAGKVNPQNLPRGSALRRAVEAPDGYVIVAGDLSQIEARMLCYVAGERRILEQFRNGEDVYSIFASKVYGRPVNKNEHPVERFVGKVGVLSLGYGVGWVKFRNTLVTGQMGMVVDVDEGTAKGVVDTYRNTNKNIVALWRKCDHALERMACGESGNITDNILFEGASVRLPTGMDLFYPHLHMDEDGNMVFARGSRTVMVYNEASGSERKRIVRKRFTRIYGAMLVENIMQALTRTITLGAMVEIAERYKPVLQVHDENVFLVPKSEAEEAVDFITQVMSEPPAWAADIPVECEVAYGENYGEAK